MADNHKAIVQLGMFSLPLAVLVAIFTDGAKVLSYDFLFQGFDAVVMTIVLLTTLGGLLVAAVMRYTSTLLKCIAVSLSICVCSSYTSVLGDEQISLCVVCGVFLVISSCFLFST